MYGDGIKGPGITVVSGRTCEVAGHCPVPRNHRHQRTTFSSSCDLVWLVTNAQSSSSCHQWEWRRSDHYRPTTSSGPGGGNMDRFKDIVDCGPIAPSRAPSSYQILTPIP